MQKDATQTIDGMLVTGFTVNDAAFGIDARLVLEVVKVGDVTPVHGAPSGVCGIRNLRGRIVTVVDMAAHLGLGRVAVGPKTRLLIIDHQGEPYGFLVDTVTDAFDLTLDRIIAPPAGMNPALRNRLTGVWRKDECLTAILNADTLFNWNDETI